MVLAYTVRRILLTIPVLFGMTIVVFSIIYAIPGDPAQTILGERATEEALERLREELGLNNPWYVQYFYYLANLLTGDLGMSLRTKVPISEEIGTYLTGTIELTMVSLIIAVFIGVNAGIISAWRQNSLPDYAAMLLALIGVSMPVFWLGLMEQWIFAQELGVLPSIGRHDARSSVDAITGLYVIDTLLVSDWKGLWDVVKHLILPGIALGTIPMALIARITRSSMLDVMNSDYIRTARAKGLREFVVVYKHALKNAFIPVLTVIGLQAGLLLGGAVLTETIFGWPGIGSYIYEAIQFRDYPVIQSGILVVATIFVLVNLVVDLLYSYVDPRIHYE